MSLLHPGLKSLLRSPVFQGTEWLSPVNAAHCSGLIPLQATTHAPNIGSHAPLLPRQPSSAHAHSLHQELPFLLCAWLIPIQFSAQQGKYHFFRKPSSPVSPTLLKEGRDCPESISSVPRSQCVDSELSTHLLSICYEPGSPLGALDNYHWEAKQTNVPAPAADILIGPCGERKTLKRSICELDHVQL